MLTMSKTSFHTVLQACRDHARACAIFHHGKAQMPRKCWQLYDWDNPPPPLLEYMQTSTGKSQDDCLEALEAAQDLHLIGGVGVGPVIVLRRGRELLESPMATWAVQCNVSGRLDGRAG